MRAVLEIVTTRISNTYLPVDVRDSSRVSAHNAHRLRVVLPQKAPVPDLQDGGDELDWGAAHTSGGKTHVLDLPHLAEVVV